MAAAVTAAVSFPCTTKSTNLSARPSISPDKISYNYKKISLQYNRGNGSVGFIRAQITTDAPPPPVKVEKVSKKMEEGVVTNKFRPKEPYTGRCLLNTKITGDDAPGETWHMVFSTEGELPYREGQSVGVIPDGIDKNGKPHKVRLYSIASSALGDFGDSKTVSLCVKRLVYTNDQGEVVKGVCSCPPKSFSLLSLHDRRPPSMSLTRSFLSRRSSSIRCFSLSKSLKEFVNIDTGGGVIGGGEKEESGENDGLSDSESSGWANLLPELLTAIIGQIEASQDKWPNRRDVVACACVCRKWRGAVRQIVKSPASTGSITFPSCLKQPGPRDLPLQCLIKRDKRNSTFYLYLSVSPSSFAEKGKFLLAARRYRHGPHTEYVISLDADDISQGSHAYVGKLSSDFLGTNFTIYNSEPPHNGAKPSSSRSTRRFASKQISPQVPASNFEVGRVSYKFNLFKSRGPRRMVCSIKCPRTEANAEETTESSKIKKTNESASQYSTILNNKAPRWHEHLQCWCLNFHGRVTVASVKNFQLVATVDESQPGGKGDEETVVLQFGKVGDDTFTMDYRQPLSALNAFAICLTSFGTKLACE